MLRLGTTVNARQTIDISGRIIAPGFIDIHTHTYDPVNRADVWEGEDNQRYFAPNFVSQGVTTVVSNECGYGTTDIALQRNNLTDNGTGPNVIQLIGHNSVRRTVMSPVHERASGYSPMWYVPSQDKSDPPSMIDNLLELIEVGERTNGRIIVTHIKARGYDFWGGSSSIIRLISDARDRGVDI